MQNSAINSAITTNLMNELQNFVVRFYFDAHRFLSVFVEFLSHFAEYDFRKTIVGGEKL